MLRKSGNEFRDTWDWNQVGRQKVLGLVPDPIGRLGIELLEEDLPLLDELVLRSRRRGRLAPLDHSGSVRWQQVLRDSQQVATYWHFFVDVRRKFQLLSRSGRRVLVPGRTVAERALFDGRGVIVEAVVQNPEGVRRWHERWHEAGGRNVSSTVG